MTADVYMGDEFSVPEAAGAVIHVIRLRADAQPDVLLRIASQLAFLNCVPIRFSLGRNEDETVAATLLLSGCTAQSVELARRKLQQLTCVTEIELTTHGKETLRSVP